MNCHFYSIAGGLRFDIPIGRMDIKKKQKNGLMNKKKYVKNP